MLKLLSGFIPKKCPECGRIRFGVKERRQHTQYNYDPDNYVKCCSKCIVRINDDWDHLWREYYMSLGV